MVERIVMVATSADNEAKELVEKFLGSKKLPRYILGRNTYAQELALHVQIEGFIDDYTEEVSFLGKPILKSGGIPYNSVVVSTSMAIHPVTVEKKLRTNGVENIINFLDIKKYSDLPLRMPFLDQALSDYKENEIEYERIFARLVDKKSKQTFLDLMSMRLNHNFSSMQSYVVDPIGQYFEDFLDLGKDEVFADVGAYDGQTTVEFIRHCPNYNSCYIFEPSKDNIAQAEKKLSQFRNIHFFNKGLSDKKAVLKFADNTGSSNRLSEDGNVEVEVDKLDDLLDRKLTFVKMDIEGAEGLALAGAQKHIEKDHPKLAVSVYHKPADMWQIPQKIFKIRNDYEIYLRHYTQGTDETVMFFMPKV